MKSKILLTVFLAAFLLSIIACRNSSKNNPVVSSEKSKTELPAGLVLIGQDMITEVIVHPDTLGDPWEVDKVKGFKGDQMFKTLFERIYSKNLTVYNCLNEEPLKPAEIKKLEKEFNSDLSRIAKIQFLEDWFFDPSTNAIVKKIKSVSFGYEVQREGGLGPGYVALFRVKTE